MLAYTEPTFWDSLVLYGFLILVAFVYISAIALAMCAADYDTKQDMIRRDKESAERWKSLSGHFKWIIPDCTPSKEPWDIDLE